MFSDNVEWERGLRAIMAIERAFSRRGGPDSRVGSRECLADERYRAKGGRDLSATNTQFDTYSGRRLFFHLFSAPPLTRR
jgi:hypothetical protein